MRSASAKSRKWLWLSLAATLVAAMAALWTLIESLDIPPRRLGPYLERRASGHNPFIVNVGQLMNSTLLKLDRGQTRYALPSGLRIGAQERGAVSSAASGNVILVHSSEEAVRAFANARPGDVITFMPGTYHIPRTLNAVRPGMPGEPIVVRAERPRTVQLNMATGEGVMVAAPYWTFENLNITGVCTLHAYCQHAFHVVGKASHFIARNNVISGFNSHFKINGFKGSFPDHGLIEHNTLTNPEVRQTSSPVTVVDLVAASHWIIRKNIIADFTKGQGDGISYGAFVKGGGTGNRLEQNIVFCESRVRPATGQRVGLSLGGGGTGPQYCRDGRCVTEQDKGVIQSNLIAHCSDDGIYVNKAAGSLILHNTLIDTGGIAVRFPETSADVAGNLVDGIIRVRDDALMRAVDNLDTGTASLYLGRHPVQHLFAAESGSEFSWIDEAPRRKEAAGTILDLCGNTQQSRTPVYGAFERFSDCRW